MATPVSSGARTRPSQVHSEDAQRASTALICPFNLYLIVTCSHYYELDSFWQYHSKLRSGNGGNNDW